MLIYPQINPVAFSFGPVHVYWYGVMYLLGFTMAYLLGRYRAKRYALPWSNEHISDLIFYAAMGVIIGGRLGYMFFYETRAWLSQPWIVFKVWEGGMSFHGGLIGVALAMLFFAHKTKKPFLQVIDFLAPLAPMGFAFGRLGNFINGELVGRATQMPWGMLFPSAPDGPRHPSQLYELGLEGIVLFVIVWWYAAKPRPLGCVSAVFLIGYSMARMLSECFRQPDIQLGFLAFDWLTMGQLLSFPMLIIGLLLWWVKRNESIS